MDNAQHLERVYCSMLKHYFHVVIQLRCWKAYRESEIKTDSTAWVRCPLKKKGTLTGDTVRIVKNSEQSAHTLPAARWRLWPLNPDLCVPQKCSFHRPSLQPRSTRQQPHMRLNIYSRSVGTLGMVQWVMKGNVTYSKQKCVHLYNACTPDLLNNANMLDECYHRQEFKYRCKGFLLSTQPACSTAITFYFKYNLWRTWKLTCDNAMQFSRSLQKHNLQLLFFEFPVLFTQKGAGRLGVSSASGF